MGGYTAQTFRVLLAVAHCGICRTHNRYPFGTPFQKGTIPLITLLWYAMYFITMTGFVESDFLKFNGKLTALAKRAFDAYFPSRLLAYLFGNGKPQTKAAVFTVVRFVNREKT